jgi:GAF domain-containing protein/anti-sigma regulatory factor (Ser/Thr protein kinase)
MRRTGSARYGLTARTPLARYGAAALLALLAVGIGRVLTSYTDGPPYALVVGAVAVAVWYGGFGPGLLAVVVGWSFAAVVLSEGPGIGLAEQDELQWATSLVVGLVVVWVSLVLRRGRERAATAAVEAEESTRQIESIQSLTTALSAALTPADVAHELIRRTPPLIGARGGAVGLIEGDELVIVDPSGVTPQTHAPGLRLPLTTEAPLTRAAADGVLKRAHDRATFEREFPDGASLSPYAQAALAVPLSVGGHVVGAMSFLFDRPDSVHEEADAIAAIAADLGGQALERSRLYEREQQWRQALDRILRAAPRLYAGTTDEISLEICREARHTLGADITEIWHVDADWVWLELVCRDPEGERLSPRARLEIADLPGLREAVETLELTFVPDAEEALTGRLLDYVRRVGIRSWLWAPIAVGGRAERVLFFSWESVLGEPDPSMMLLARRFSEHAGLALEQLERREAEEEAARRALETQRLLDSTAALAAASTPQEVTGAILREGLRSLGAASGVVVAVNDDGDELEIIDSHGYRPETLAPWATIALDADVPVALAARDDVLVAIESPGELESRFPAVAATRTEPTGSWLALPLRAGGSALGAVGLSFSTPRTFSEAELDFAQALARQSSQALERAMLLAAEYAARTRAEELVVLTSALSEAVSPSDVVRAVRGQLLGQASVNAAGVYVLGRNGVGLELVDAEGSELGSGAGLRQLALDASSPLAESARERRAVWIDTEDQWGSYDDADSWHAAGIRRLGAVPLVADRRLVGVLAVGFEPEGEVDDDLRVSIEAVGSRAAQALERAWLMEREQAARVSAETASRRTRRLQSITEALAAAPTPREVAEIVVREAAAAVAGDVAVLFAFDDNREAPEVLASLGTDESGTTALTAPVADAALRGSLVVVDSEPSTDLVASAVRAAAEEAGLHGAVCVPLGVGSRIPGALFVGFRSRAQLAAEDIALVQTLARIGAQALERSRLFDDEHRLRQRTERVQLMTEALSGSLTQRDVAEVVVEALVQGAGADGAALSIVVEDRQVQKKLAWRGYEPEAQEPWLEIPLQARTPGNLALDTGQIVFYEELDSLAEDFPEAATRMRLTGHESFLFVPLVSGGRTNGLVITSFAEPVSLGDEDRAFVETLASQAAQALDRARSFESERTIAETLQRSVLPASLPTLPNVQLAARYLPGTDEVDVGGDWFDAILFPTGRLGLAVGDVVGKGVQSAATMAQLRNALRAFALDQMKPAATISRLNRLTEEIAESAFATVVYAVLEPDTGVCRFTSAGHPPPLLVHPDGSAEYIEGGRGLPLGTGASVRYRQATVELPVGSTVILYTDGLIERRSESIDEGLERLRIAAETAPGDPERLVEHVLEHVAGSEGRGDDIAVLAVRLLAVAPKPLELDLPSGVRSLDLVRDALRVWLEDAPVTQTESHDIVLATWEACANAVEHPVPGDGRRFVVRAELEDSTILVTVTDPGRWADETERPDRGLGLRLIRSVMSSVEIDSGAAGTRVRLEKVLAGRHPAVASVPTP